MIKILIDHMSNSVRKDINMKNKKIYIENLTQRGAHCKTIN